jgi:cobalt-zinc-cadmium resistance protein CzcA
VADINLKIGPLQINREKNLRRWAITANIRGRDMGSVVEDIQEVVAEKIELPTGYFLEYGGQFKNQIRAMSRLSYIVPIAIGMIFVMLYMAFNCTKTAFLIIISIPLSLIGGVFGLYVTGEYLSVPASIGFIALFGIAVQDAMVLVSCIKQQRESGMEVEEAIITGSMLRLRPVLITSITTFLGLLPLLMSTGVGAEIQRPLAVVVIFGLISSTLLTLIIKPALFGLFEGKD